MISAVAASLAGAASLTAAGLTGAMLGSALAERITPYSDAPPQERVPVIALAIACAAVGAAIGPHAGILQFSIVALVCVALVALWVTDARRGIVPDTFTLGPLAVMLVVASLQRQLLPFMLSAAVPFVPFAIAALCTRGRGMGWGDVKLAALGGAVLGAQLSLLAFSIACLAAAIISFARGRTRGPIAFAPYMAAAIGVAMPLGRW